MSESLSDCKFIEVLIYSFPKVNIECQNALFWCDCLWICSGFILNSFVLWFSIKMFAIFVKCHHPLLQFLASCFKIFKFWTVARASLVLDPDFDIMIQTYIFFYLNNYILVWHCKIWPCISPTLIMPSPCCNIKYSFAMLLKYFHFMLLTGGYELSFSKSLHFTINIDWLSHILCMFLLVFR